jgi:arginyl-tRNA synthetase
VINIARNGMKSSEENSAVSISNNNVRNQQIMSKKNENQCIFNENMKRQWQSMKEMAIIMKAGEYQ